MKEKRAFECSEIRAEETEDGKRMIRGYAAVFGKDSVPMGFSGNIREQVRKGAFQRTLKEGDVRALWSHNPDIPLGRTKNKTLTLREDDTGLSFMLELPDTQAGRDAFTSIKRGDVTGMSFGFEVRKDEWKRGENNEPHRRTLLDVELYEVSPVAFPAYPDTQVQARSLEKLLEAHEKEWNQADQADEESEQRHQSRIDKLKRAERKAKLFESE